MFAVIDDPTTMEISGEVMARAIEIMQWYLCEYLRLSGISRIAPMLKQAQALYDWMKAHPAEKMPFRDIIQLGPRFARSKSAAEPLILKLIEHGLIEEVSSRPRAFRILPEATEYEPF